MQANTNMCIIGRQDLEVGKRWIVKKNDLYDLN